MHLLETVTWSLNCSLRLQSPDGQPSCSGRRIASDEEAMQINLNPIVLHHYYARVSGSATEAHQNALEQSVCDDCADLVQRRARDETAVWEDA